MNGVSRSVASIVTAGMIAATTLPAFAASPSPTRGVATSQSLTRFQVAAVPHSIVPSTDFGRRLPAALVTATVMLQYNRPAELDALVNAQSNPKSPLYHHFLSSAQFNGYFAPTPQQQAYVAAVLQAAGLRVTQSFANRTILDVVGTSASAETFFGTEIHTISQGRYGLRFANVKPATLPANIASLVRSVSLSNLVVARTRPMVVSHSVASASVRPVAVALAAPPAPGVFELPVSDSAEAVPNHTNIVEDPGFESGALGHGWGHCQTHSETNPLATITSRLAHTGKYAAQTGSSTKTSGEQFGGAGVCQLVKIPASGALSAYLYQITNDTSRNAGGQDVFLLDTTGHVTKYLELSANNLAGWVKHNWNLSSFAGRSVYLYFGVHGDGNRGHYTQQYVDDVSLTGSGVSPSPSPSPSMGPSPSPSPSPSIGPSPSPSPSASPVACTGRKESGPFRNSNGWLPTGVAVAFDFPVQHGCSGATQTAALVIDNSVSRTDLNAYLAAAGVTQTGTFTNVAVDGGGVVDDKGEATLDVESIVGLAPGANVIDYNIGSLTGQRILDAYNKAVSDNLADAVNSSFGGCESADPTGEMAEDAVAVQGAAKGITFVGTSGDAGSDECGTTPPNSPPGVSGTNGPHFLSVGSIDFAENATTGALIRVENSIVGENGFGGFYSGGGVSTVYPLPSYQAGIRNVVTTGRNQPDIALPGDAVAVYGGGTASTDYGTSWSGPEVTALLTETVQVHNGTRLGFVNPAIYALFKATGYTDFYDIVGGNNGAYNAVAGYDQVTGIGAPKGFAFALAL